MEKIIEKFRAHLTEEAKDLIKVVKQEEPEDDEELEYWTQRLKDAEEAKTLKELIEIAEVEDDDSRSILDFIVDLIDEEVSE